MIKRLLLAYAVITMFCVPPNILATTAPVRPQFDLRNHPNGNTKPVRVAVGMYITNLADIDETKENFELVGYFIAKWHDPRLVIPPGANNSATDDKPRRFQMTDIWIPPVVAANSISHKTNSYSVEADKNGNVTIIERFDSVLSNTYQLKRFPFDTQVLQIEFEPFLSDNPEIQFASQPLPGTGFRQGGHVEVAAWHVMDMRYTTETVASDGTLPSSRDALFLITVRRQSGFYIWKIFLPIVIMSLIPMFVFWIDPKEFDWLLKVPMWMLLSTVAFEFAIMRDMPKIGYLTFLDAVINVSFAFFFLVIIEITTAYLVQQGESRQLVVRVHSAGRWAYPAAYFIVLLVLALHFLA